MDEAQTAPFALGEGTEACLLLHGFTGSPWEMRPLGEALAARGYHVRCPLLPGHGGTPEALVHVGERDWQEAVEAEATRALAGHRRLYVAGLSVGALLGVRSKGTRLPVVVLMRVRDGKATLAPGDFVDLAPGDELLLAAHSWARRSFTAVRRLPDGDSAATESLAEVPPVSRNRSGATFSLRDGRWLLDRDGRRGPGG